MSLLPEIRSEEDYRAVRWDPAVWLPALREVCARHDLDPAAFSRATDGTHVVFLGPELVVKLFVGIWAEDHRRERAALASLTGSGLPIPDVPAEGELEGWPYLLQRRLRGTAIKHVWPRLDLRDQLELAGQLGAFLARLHEVPVDACADPLASDDWPTFVAERRARGVEHHARGGAPGPWLEDVARALDVMPPPAAERRLLHADLTSDHALVAQDDDPERGPGGCWRLVGVIDWADALLGSPLYDLATPAVFLGQGRPGVGRALLRGYGLDPDAAPLDGLVQAMLIHKYGHVMGALRHAHGPPARALRALRRTLWETVASP